MEEETIDVATELRKAFEQASPEARELVATVLEIERANQHLDRPHVGREIEAAIAKAAKAAKP